MIFDKREIRNNVRAAVAAMLVEERLRASENVCRQILDSTEWKSASTVLLYSSMPDEVSTDALINAATASGKRILLPVICPGNELKLCVYDPSQLHKEPLYGIVEPDEDALTLADYAVIDLAIIPGRAFTIDGRRLGRGKGYYDRLLPKLRCPLWGVAFRCQIVPSIPTEPHDAPMHKVLFDR